MAYLDIFFYVLGKEFGGKTETAECRDNIM